MNTLIEPNWHPLIVHFVIAFLITGPLLLIASTMSSGQKRDGLRSAGDWMLALGTVAVIAAIAAGLQAYYSVAHDDQSHAAMTDHRNWAFVTAGLFLIFVVWRYVTRQQAPTKVYAWLLIVPVLLLCITGWKGARLVYHYGLGVSNMPVVTGEGHDHERASGYELGSPENPSDHHSTPTEIGTKKTPINNDDHHTENVLSTEEKPEHDHSTHNH